MDATSTSNKTSTARRVKYYVTASLALLTCPCHIPILLFLLSGTAAGAFLASNVWLVLAVVLPIFLFSVVTAMRSFELSGDNDKLIAKKAVSTKLPGHPRGKINNIG